MKSENLEVGAFYEIKYRKTQGTKYGQNTDKLRKGVGKLIKIDWGYSDRLHVFEVNKSPVYVTSNGVIKKSKGVQESILPAEVEADWKTEAEDILKSEIFLEDLEELQALLEGVGIKTTLYSGMLQMNYVHAKKLHFLLQKVYVSIMLEGE